MLSFMLYFSCAYDGIYIGNERWMNLMEYGNIDVWPCDMMIGRMEMN